MYRGALLLVTQKSVDNYYNGPQHEANQSIMENSYLNAWNAQILF